MATWVIAGVITLLQTLVTAELTTRFPRAGGEYQFLKEAYGEFAAFFFGWSFTIFIVGAGAASIAAAMGEFVAELLSVDAKYAPALGCAGVALVVGTNAAGLRTGAATQNALTIIKTLALVAIGVGALIVAGRFTPATGDEVQAATTSSGIEPFFLALLPAFWSYTGATDPAKLAEETRDVRRGLPIALAASALVLTVVYCFYNYALLCAVSPARMAGHRSVPSLIFTTAGAGWVNWAILLASAMICLGALSSMFLANVRVTYALARDGLTFRFLGEMSRGQSPVASQVIGGLIACAFVFKRNYGQILQIYFMASTVLFGLTYASLIVFRRRERAAGRSADETIFRLPMGGAIAILLIGVELAIAASIAVSDWRTGSRDSLWTVALLVGLAALYGVWRTMHSRRAA
jgi:APA family basic amino acid/polyamine antiporter